VQVNEVLEAALVHLQARNNPHAAAAVEASLHKGATPAPAPLGTAGGGALGVGGTPQQAAAEAAFAHARRLVLAQARGPPSGSRHVAPRAMCCCP
jgi:hypothetical protein